MRSLPERVDSAVVETALARFGLNGPADFLGRSQNYVFAVEHARQHYILRISHADHQRPEDIESELDWNAHLSRHEVGIAQACSSRANRFVERIEGPDAAYSACLYERAPGRELRFHENSSDWDRAIHRRLGALLGRLHRATTCYEPSAGIVSRRRWDSETVFHLSEAANVFSKEDADLQTEFRYVWEWLESLPEDADCFGLTHNDAHRGNFYYADNRITLFDTSAAFYCWFAYDLAQPLYYSGPVFFGNRAATPDMLAELKTDLVAGYRDEFPIPDLWVKRIDGFVRLRRLQMHCSVYWQHGGPIEADWFVRNRESMKIKEPLL